MAKIGILDKPRFKSPENLERLLLIFIRAADLKMIGKPFCQVYPAAKKTDIPGMTIIQCLRESHAALETYPEAGLVELMISSCKDFDLRDFPAMMEDVSGWAKIVDYAHVIRKEGRWTLSEVLSETGISARNEE